MDRPEAGWYPDPAQPGRVRYFDGVDWTDHTSDTAPLQATDGGLPPGESSHAADGTAATEPLSPAGAPAGDGGGDGPAVSSAPDGHGGGDGPAVSGAPDGHGGGDGPAVSGAADRGRSGPGERKGGRGMVVIVAIVLMVLVVAGSVYLGTLVDGDEPGVGDLAEQEIEAEPDDVTDADGTGDAGDPSEGGDPGDEGAAGTDDPGAEDADGPDPAEDTQGPDPGDAATRPDTAGELEPAERDGMYDGPFELTIDPTASYLATIVTPYGDIVVELDPAGAPMATNNLVNLADDGFYDGVTFHRVIEGFVIQGGDPSGTGAGGPGYRFEDELETAEQLVDAEGGYPRGTLAMANAGPDTNGSQFFIVHGELIDLQPAYTVFGTVVEGIEVVDAIAGLSTDAADRPVATATITTVDITHG